ncbi:uncharacterized protein MYCGRDRAFT_93769 [Zymoseptoria tritici IPO323]|uniref:DUF6604 domain-containing protein n=1 Tax=Zymoseptoria tritici (strain CBS 115943 / IPO323) TaxID=336722 RepID=F9XCZ2_ZYMTI|nr:uncharacterized protein MYCGRDRAFT_93769 [Zymoseptoria tritici IPO323]EGP86396.1 hypothetical protein MYCGRDRAFT_93769 [Zymoseptoria tritici IPO323]
MRDDLFYDSYRRYKRGTDKIAEWLANADAFAAPNWTQTEPSVRPTKPTGETTVSVGPNINIFDALDLEDIAEPVVYLEVVKGSKGKAPNDKKKSRAKDSREVFEISSSAEELLFLLFCFFKDLHDVQTYLLEMWVGQKNGHVSLTSAAATTDLAFDVNKRKEDELLRSEWVDGIDGGSTTTVLERLTILQKTRTASAVPLYWKFEKKENGSAGLDAVTRVLFTHLEEPQSEDVDSSTVDSDDEDSDSSVVDLKELALLTSMLNLAPKRLVTDEKAKVALKKAKKTPFNKMSVDGQEYIKGLEAGGVDVSKGLMGILRGKTVLKSFVASK